MVKIHLFNFIGLILAGILPPTFAQAKSNCEVTVQVNDPQASISVDNVFVGFSPLIIPCTNAPQTIHIVNSDQKSFSRVLPPLQDFNPLDNFWNVKLQSFLPYRTQGFYERKNADVQGLAARLDQMQESLQKIQAANSSLRIFADNGVRAFESRTIRRRIF